MSIIKIRRILVDMLLDIDNHFYGTYITIYRKGIKLLINQCLNDIYGNMVKSILYYCNFCKTLKANKFKVNPYGLCVANQMVNVFHILIIFHANYCKLIHKYLKSSHSFIGVLRE